MPKVIVIRAKSFEIDKPLQVVKMATIVKSHIVKNNLFVPIKGKNYVMVEGWQFAGGLLGLFPRVVKVEELEKGRWFAEVHIIDKRTGSIVSSGFAVCSKTEDRKRSFDDYAILSMAQTRAIGKAFRNLIGWVMNLAGYEGTPAEEMPKKSKVEKVEPETQLMTTADKIEKIKTRAKALGLNTPKQIAKRIGINVDFDTMTKKQAAIVYYMLMQTRKI